MILAVPGPDFHIFQVTEPHATYWGGWYVYLREF